MNVDLNSLKLFVAVAAHGSFTKAAESLEMERSTLSRRIAALEDDLGLKLFHRTTRRIEVTTAGRGMLRKLAPLMERLDVVLEGIPERSNRPSGTLRITASVDIGTWVLPSVLSGFCALYPEVFPSVDLTNRIVDLEGEGFDLGLRVASGLLDDSSLIVRRLGRLRNRLYASPAYLGERGLPERPEDLREHDLIALRGWRGPEALALASKRVETNDVALVRELTRAGLGMGLMPEFMARRALDRGELVPVLDAQEFGEPTLFAVFPSTRAMPSKVTAFRDYLVDFVESNGLFEA